MPKLLYFLPCDRVILSKEDTLSLITIIEYVTVTLDPQKVDGMPEDGGVPKEWVVVSAYEWGASDFERKYEQRVRLILSNGRVTTETITKIPREPDKKRSRNIVTVLGFPIVPPGEASLQLAIREISQENWQDIADYTITITHKIDAPESPPATSIA